YATKKRERGAQHWPLEPDWLSAAAVGRRHRQRDPHGLSDISAFRAHVKRSEPADRRPGAHFGVHRRGGRQTGLRGYRRAHRRGGNGVADRGGDRARHRSAFAALVGGFVDAAAAGRDRAQWHLVCALRFRAGPGDAGAPPACLWDFLYRYDRRRRGIAGDLRIARRRGRRPIGADSDSRGGAVDAADYAGAATGFIYLEGVVIRICLTTAGDGCFSHALKPSVSGARCKEYHARQNRTPDQISDHSRANDSPTSDTAQATRP